MTNRLSQERSPYLRHASGQKIDWYPWSDEAFVKAAQEDKPVFLSSGAVWCHWCHVMAAEAFQDDEVCRILNEMFVSVKLDRDERPDIDKRYQKAVFAMSNTSGWPLTVFLTPERQPFFGGTYFPVDDAGGRPGFRKVLTMVSDFYRTRRGDALNYAERLIDFLKPGQSTPEEIDAGLLEQAEEAVTSAADLQNGGFGTSPKFPMPGAIEFLLNRHVLKGSDTAGVIARQTLLAMTKGGFRDQIGGGFHRYSVDEGWIVPHFEKMADDNAWLLRNYLTAYAVFGDDYLREAAEGIVAFVSEVLSDPSGGFYASQDADVTPDDEGGYFTWRDEELKRLLGDEEYRLLSLHLMHEKGAMHHDDSKRVLFVAMGPEEIAKQTGIDAETVAEVIGKAKVKLIEARRKRKTPFIDTTLYTSLNGMFITSYLAAARILGRSGHRDFALRSLDRIMADHLIDDVLLHTKGVPAVLDDYVFIIEALVAAYETTGDAGHLGRADDLAARCIEKFWDSDAGGFFDTDSYVLGVRLKAVEDIPHPSANSVAIMQLLKLFAITGKSDYREYAEKGLKVFAKDAAEMTVHAGYFFCSLDAYYHMIGLTVGARPGSDLARKALSTRYYPYTAISYGDETGAITPCLASGVCLEPLRSPDQLADFLKSQTRLK